MAKDYARRYNRKSPVKQRKKASVIAYVRRLFVFSVFILIIAAGVYGYVYYHQHGQNAAITKPAPTKTVPAAPVTDAEEDPVNYEFYTLLPQIAVPDPKQDTAPPDEQPGYWLQLMVYYNMRDASAFVDRLQLSGLDPVITQRKSTKTDHDLFVVVIGPFTSKEHAIARQQDLKKINISSYIFHIDPPAATTIAETTATQQVADVPVTDAVAD